MKKFCSILFLFGVLFAVTAAFTEEEQRQFRENVVEKCKESTQATDEDVKTMKMHEIPKTQSAKCFAACILEKLGSIADGKVVVDVLKAIGEQKYAGNDKAIGTFKEISDECAGVSGSDHCELSANLIECMNNAAIARGVDLNKGIQA